jgi:hypothetical protein
MLDSGSSVLLDRVSQIEWKWIWLLVFLRIRLDWVFWMLDSGSSVLLDLVSQIKWNWIWLLVFLKDSFGLGLSGSGFWFFVVTGFLAFLSDIFCYH